MSEVSKIVQAEKGNNLSPQNLHIRLRMVEIVLLVSVCLNLLHWYVAGEKDQNLQNQMNDVKIQTGVH